jgi:hypothetical protein
MHHGVAPLAERQAFAEFQMRAVMRPGAEALRQRHLVRPSGIDLPRPKFVSAVDHTAMFWFRSQQSQDGRANGDGLLNKP